MNIISINNLSFKYDNNVIFKDLDLNIVSDSFSTIIGRGKTTLSKILCGLLKYEGQILINDVDTKKIGYSIDFNSFYADNVRDEIALPIRKDMQDSQIEKAIKYVCSIIPIGDFINDDISNLSASQKQLVSLAKSLIIKPEILILDDALSMVDDIKKEVILNNLKKLSITIINFTNDIEQLLYSDYIGKIVNGKIKYYSKEQFFEKYKKDVPYVVSLSDKLKYYDLVNKKYYDMKNLIGDLWN